MSFLSRVLGKDSAETKSEETVFSATFDKEKQIISALNMVGAGFEARGGSSLMLTEAVENGVDAIIKFNQSQKKKIAGKIRVIIDQINKRIIVIDNGTGFLQIKHVCEKPFDSLKEEDDTQTGRFARGLQGFRAFCNNLSYITKRLPKNIPVNDSEYINSNNTSSNLTARIEFEANTNKVRVKYVDGGDDSKFLTEEHGTVALYERWKPGLFKEFDAYNLQRRLQHHFGELIRKGEISIVVEMMNGTSAEELKSIEVEPRDYSDLEPIDIPVIPYTKNGNSGEITFNLYLSDKGRADRWNQPFLLFQGRPVGDGFISGIDEFSEHPIWKHRLLTGFVTCDFCEINELRQGLKINEERDFLFNELLKIEKLLEKKVKEHAKGLYELKLQKQVSELVKDLQLFFKAKNIFNFKIAKSTGFLSKENNEIEVVEIAKTPGVNADLEVPNENGEGTIVSGKENFVSTEVQKQIDGTDKTQNPGNNGNGGNSSGGGEPREDTNSNTDHNQPTGEGIKPAQTGSEKTSDTSEPHESGGKEKSKKKGTRHKPRGFGMVFQDDEFNEDLSWFDDISSMVIINSQHQRYLSRQNDETQFKSLMNYLAELYIWEITKLVHAKDEEINRTMKFLDYKFEYLETVRQDEKEGRFGNDHE